MGALVGLDGKTYPRPISRDSRLALVGMVHALRHDDGLTVRQIFEVLTARDVPRSIGTISAYLSRYTCTDCPVQVTQTAHLNTPAETRNATGCNGGGLAHHQKGNALNNNTIVTEIAPAVREIFDDLDTLKPGFVCVLQPGNAFYTPIEDVRVRRASELEDPDNIEVDDMSWTVEVYDRAGELQRLVDLPDGWWEDATADITINRAEHAVTRLHGDYLLVSKGMSIVTGIHTVDGERTFEFTSSSRFRESILEEKRRYLELHPEIVADRPLWADASNVVEFDEDEAMVTHSRAFGLVTIECSPTYVNGVLTSPDEPTVMLPNRVHESTADPDLMRELACDLVAAADAIDPTQSTSIGTAPLEWVTDAVAEQEDGHIIRSVTHHVGIFETEVTHSRLLTNSGFRDYGVDATIGWSSIDADGRSGLEHFSVKLDDIPGLIRALLVAQAVAK